MATGIPKRAPTPGGTSDPAAFRLTYPGKAAEADILSTPPAVLDRIWSPAAGPDPNRLYYAENEGVLAALLADPAVRGRVELVYIDPPFATNARYISRGHAAAYDDTLDGPAFVESLRRRLVLLRELLSPTGSLYLHIDEKMVFQVKLILDEVFGPKQYRNCVTRKKCNPKNYTRRQYGNVADYVLFYTRSAEWTWNRPTEPREATSEKEYRYTDPDGRRYMKVPVHAPGARNGETGKPWRGVLPPPGKHWQYPPAKLDELDAKGEIYWSPNGNPRRKVYLDEQAGAGVQDIWLEFRDAHNQNVEITGYPTEKNPALLDRIVAASSNPGDLVLDAFAGSGTTLASASRLGRRWVGVDRSPEAITHTLRRFTSGTEKMGDYVSVRRPAKRVSVGSLFGDEEDDRPAGGPGWEPIRDFEFYTTPEVIRAEADRIAGWVAGLSARR
jgi:adenine-specific DNA-methyltransferase